MKDNKWPQYFSVSQVRVAPEDPYREADGITITDPDGWRIVLMNKKGFKE